MGIVTHLLDQTDGIMVLIVFRSGAYSKRTKIPCGRVWKWITVIENELRKEESSGRGINK